MTPPDDTAVVGFAELSATAVRARLLDAPDRFWDIDTRAFAPSRVVPPVRRLRHPGRWFDDLAVSTGARVVLTRSLARA